MNWKSFHSILLVLLCLPNASCNRIKDEGKNIYTVSKEKTKDLADKIHPHFDAYKADTKYNKKRFKDFIQVPISSDVENIYCFDDAIGIDADYQFAFNCNENTAKKIIEKHHLKEDTTDPNFSSGLQTEFEWWNIKKVNALPLFSWGNEDQTYFKYFWFDRKEQKAYFFDFDM